MSVGLLRQSYSTGLHPVISAKKSILLFAISIIVYSFADSQIVNFDDFFVDKSLRIDYWHAGSTLQESIVLDRIYQQGTWAGNPKKLMHVFPYGCSIVKAYDLVSQTLMFSHRYDRNFAEYKITDPATKGAE